MNRVQKTVAGAATAMVVTLGTLGGFAAAESSSGTPAQPTTSAVDGSASRPTRAERRAENQKDLAAALGITTDQLTAGEKKVFTDRVNGRVTSGQLTRAQGDALIAAFGTGNLPSVAKSIALDKLPARLEKAVQNGRITQAQADSIEAAVKSGDLSGLSNLPLRAQHRIEALMGRGN